MQEWLIVDGYNVIGAWPELSALAEESLEDARESLLHSLCNHCGYTGQTLMLVFDAHQSRERERRELLHVGRGKRRRTIGEMVFTMRGETADNFIEKFVRAHTGEPMTVASSDGLVQVLIFAYATRISARELGRELDRVAKLIAEKTAFAHKKQHQLEDRLSGEVYDALDGWRKERGKEGPWRRGT